MKNATKLGLMERGMTVCDNAVKTQKTLNESIVECAIIFNVPIDDSLSYLFVYIGTSALTYQHV